MWNNLTENTSVRVCKYSKKIDKSVNKLVLEKMVLIAQATDKGSGAPAHQRRFTRALAEHKHAVETFDRVRQTRMSVAKIGDCSCVFKEPHI